MYNDSSNHIKCLPTYIFSENCRQADSFTMIIAPPSQPDTEKSTFDFLSVFPQLVQNLISSGFFYF